MSTARNRQFTTWEPKAAAGFLAGKWSEQWQVARKQQPEAGEDYRCLAGMFAKRGEIAGEGLGRSSLLVEPSRLFVGGVKGCENGGGSEGTPDRFSKNDKYEKSIQAGREG